MQSTQLRQPAKAIDPDAARKAIELVSLARAMGLLEPSDEGGVTLEEIEAALRAFTQHGIGRRHAVSPVSEQNLAEVATSMIGAAEQSPLPATEWPALARLFGEAQLAELLGISLSSVQRYGDASRPTPDDVAARLHHLVLVVADLAGSYNPIGIRRWFHRPRTALGGSTPASLLTPGWQPDDESPRRVRELSHALVTGPA